MRAARIVFVEDRPEHIFLAKAALEAEGFANKIDFFTTAEETINFMDTNLPADLIFIDLKLEHSPMQGEELAYKLMADERYAQTEICLMSASYVSREKENEYAKTNRIKFFLKKPLITDQLESVIRSSQRLRKLIVVTDDIKEAA